MKTFSERFGLEYLNKEQMLGFLLITKDKTYKEQFEENGITVYMGR